MNITKNFLSLGKMARGDTNNTTRPLLFTKPLEKIIIHWIGPYAHAPASVRNWWENGSDGKGVRASAHFVVKDEFVLQCLPLNEVGWHSGNMRNYSSIGIEVSPKDATGEFSEKTINTLRELVGHIKKETNRNLELERHFDGFQKKDCPRFYTPLTSLFEGGGRVVNPEGGQQRWEILKSFLNNPE